MAGAKGEGVPSGNADLWPVGLALVDDSGKVVEINAAGEEILGGGGPSLLEGLWGAPSMLGGTGPASGPGWSTGWIEVSGTPLELAYRMQPSDGRHAVVFHDVTARRQRERRAAAVARTAARVASERSLPATLNALAREILQADGLAGVQVLTNGYSEDKLHMLGMAGFPSARSNSFHSLLMECRELGADLRMLDVFESGKPVVIPHRYAAIMSNPAWQPLHELHRYPEWDAFASIPINVRQNTIGVLNVFVKPGKEIDDEAVDFLSSMADQAGLAIDYASLLEEERAAAHREERQRLARDLHDSVVQQIFSMGMLTQTLTVLLDGDNVAAGDARARSITEELGTITGSVLKDLRGLVAQLRPSAIEGVGLHGGLTRLAATTHRQTGVKFELHLDPGLDDIDGELGEDLYHVAAEAVHNAVKHSPADLLDVRCAVEGGRIVLTVRDNGGPHGHDLTAATAAQEGHGLGFMRQRIVRWQGSFEVGRSFGNVGTVVRASVPFMVDNRFQEEE